MHDILQSLILHSHNKYWLFVSIIKLWLNQNQGIKFLEKKSWSLIIEWRHEN